jgi:hypothetical protein
MARAGANICRRWTRAFIIVSGPKFGLGLIEPGYFAAQGFFAFAAQGLAFAAQGLAAHGLAFAAHGFAFAAQGLAAHGFAALAAHGLFDWAIAGTAPAATRPPIARAEPSERRDF